MKMNTDLYGLVFKKSNGKWTKTLYWSNFGSREYILDQMREAKKVVRRPMKMVKLSLETVD